MSESAIYSSAGTNGNAGLQAARDQTAVTRAQVTDAERTLYSMWASSSSAFCWRNPLCSFALQDLKSFQQTVDIGEAQYKAGYISEGDYPQDQTAVAAVSDRCFRPPGWRRCRPWSSLRRMLGYDAVPANFDVVGDLAYQPLKAEVEDLQAKALQERPDYRAAELGITAAQSQIPLAKANAKVDVNGNLRFHARVGREHRFHFCELRLPIFNRNQGEIARTSYALTQAQEQQKSTSDTVLIRCCQRL